MVAGDYYFGDGLGVNCSLTIMPTGRFSFRWRGCGGLYDENLGEARVEAGHLTLMPEKPNVREGFQGTPTHFLIVPWGERLYLVPDSERREFCNGVNAGTEPRDEMHGSFYLRRGDSGKVVSGLPNLPKDWDALVLRKPLQGRVVEVLGNGMARVDLGKEHGVWADMELWADSAGFGLIKVIEVGPNQAVVDSKYPKQDGFQFQVGQKVRSRLSE